MYFTAVQRIVVKHRPDCPLPVKVFSVNIGYYGLDSASISFKLGQNWNMSLTDK